jgi:hypothetical protein
MATVDSATCIHLFEMKWIKLSVPRQEISVIAALPGHDTAAPIECSLRLVSLEDAPKYCALSSFGMIQQSLKVYGWKENRIPNQCIKIHCALEFTNLRYIANANAIGI